MLTKMLLRKARPPTLAYDSSATSTGSTIVIPSVAAVGDLAVLFDYSGRESSTPTTTAVPSGWTSVSNVTGVSGSLSLRAIVSYKKLASGDPGSTITGMTSYGYAQKHLFVFAPSAPISTITVAGLEDNTYNGSFPAQTIPAQALNYVAIGCAGRFYTGGTGESWTDTWYDATTTWTSSRGVFAYKVFNASPADVSIDFNPGTYNFALLSFQTFALVVT